jgi:hypothetical protein
MRQGICFIVVVFKTDGSDHSIIDLVIVRMGLKEDPDFDFNVLKEVIGSLKKYGFSRNVSVKNVQPLRAQRKSVKFTKLLTL